MTLKIFLQKVVRRLFGAQILLDWEAHKYRHHASDVTLDWDWAEIHHNRIALVNYLVSLRGGRRTRYLEIGCASNSLFDSVFSEHKTGVDPASGGTHRMTSDAFFERNEATFDVIFIDGLHEYEQVRRDAINALACLNTGGWIALHDLLPRSWKEHHVPQVHGTWTGDCWKLAIELANTPGLDFCLLRIDHGVGVVRVIEEGVELVDMRDQLLEKEFDYFAQALKDLPLVEWTQAMDWIDASR